MRLAVVAAALLLSCFLLLLVDPAGAKCHRGHSEDDGDDDFVMLSGTASDAEGLSDIVEEFTKLLGGDDNGNDPAAKRGFRSINWDAPIVPFRFPGNFFKVNVTRGLTVFTANNRFRVSNPPDGSDDLFDSINEEASEDFSTFSPERLFSPLNQNRIRMTFSPAQEDGVAAVSGFGAVFVDVDFEETTRMFFEDKDGCRIFDAYVEPEDEGLSFLGAVFDDSIVDRVIIRLGNKPVARPGGDTGTRDIVVLDDFFYGEPIET